jgi:RNA polymerase sigma-70 factor (ECF subfamily)
MTKVLSDRHARFKASMTPHMDQMYNYAMYLTGERDEANDLLQETFLKAYRFYDKYEEGTNAKAWLYRIMRNTYINEYRRLKRLPDLVEFDEQISAPYFAPDVQRSATQFEGELFGDEIATAIARLPEKFKSVIMLRDVEDLPYEEIAEALDIPVGTVRSRLHRARALLFDRLKGYAQDRGYRVGDRFEPAELAIAV